MHTYVIVYYLSCHETWVQGRGRVLVQGRGQGCHFMKQGTWVRRGYCRHIHTYIYVCMYVCMYIYIYICVYACVCVKIYKNKTFHTHIIHAYLIFLNSMVQMNIRIENLINHMT